MGKAHGEECICSLLSFTVSISHLSAASLSISYPSFYADLIIINFQSKYKRIQIKPQTPSKINDLYKIDKIWSLFENGLYLIVGIIINLVRMMAQGQQKRLVEQYKSTNRQLRKQLQNLNNQIDKIIAFKTNRIGLKKLPSVDKNILHTQDIKLLQIEVDNLRKRLEQLTHDNQDLKERTKVNHMARAKQLQDQLAAKQAEKKAIKKQHYWMDKNSKTLNTTDVVDEQMKLYDKIEQANQELLLCRKIESDLMKTVEEMKQYQEKKTNYINQSIQTHKEVTNTIATSRMEMPITHKSAKGKLISEQEWKNLKKQFLQLKQSKQHQETSLNEQNDRLRMEIRNLEVRMKQKKVTIDNIRSLEVKRKERNYSTLENPKEKEESIRFRNRNNKYSTKV